MVNEPRDAGADVDVTRARALIEESREFVLVMDDQDRVVAASRRAREALEGLVEGARVSDEMLRSGSTRVPVRVPYEIDGRRERNFHQLALERNSVEFFTLHWTVVHPITADSPLRGVTPESLRAAPTQPAIGVSWPQACMTPLSTPERAASIPSARM